MSRPPSILIVATVLLAALTVRSSPAQSVEPRPHAKRNVADAFELHALELTLPIDTNHPLKRLYVSAFGCGGIGIGDFDGDSAPDIFAANGPGGNRLFRQESPFVFTDVSKDAGIGGGESWAGGVSVVDIDGDLDLDIYVGNYGSPNQLFINDGSGRFTERARQFGLDRSGAFIMPSFADYDRDGDLDVYLLGHRHYRENGRPPPGKVTVTKDERLVVLPEYSKYYTVTLRDANRWEINNVGAHDLLLRNDGGRFVDVSREVGLIDAPHQGNSVTWWDFNHDGWLDIYIGNDFEDPDLLYRNNGNGTFSEVAREVFPHVSWFSMGADAGDINNDGLMDLISLDMAGTTHYKSKTAMGQMNTSRYFMTTADPQQHMRNCLYINTGAGRFLESAYLSGVASSDWSWAAKFGDLDNDGWLDLFVTNGMTRNFNDSDHQLDLEKLVGATEWDQYEKRPTRPETNQAFRNSGSGLRFEDHSEAWGLNDLGMSYAAAYGDLDQDGDLDLVVANLEKPLSVYRNPSPASGNSITISLRGGDGNRFGLGAELRLETAAGVQLRQFHSMRGFSSSDEPIIHFGMGDTATAERLSIRWPDGTRQELQNLKANHHYTIEQVSDPSTEPANGNATASEVTTMFQASEAIQGVAQWELPYNDFKDQPLLPNQLSHYGPGIACGDVDGDGDDDLYCGGSSGRLGTLLINDGAGAYSSRPFNAGADERACEDMGALFFDSDGDGDQDLYVVSGSVEAPIGDERYRDRLYLNDGEGKFRLARPGTLPDLRDSGGVCVAADYDRDGDLDLFVGSRVVPGRYPEAPTQRLLRNDAGKFVDTAPEALAGAGLITGALWSDANGDGWIDLLLTCEWGPVRVFANDRGTLSARWSSEQFGWWNGISGGDFDLDGDIDYLVTNFGLNTKYHTPEVLLYGDLDGSGKKHIIEAGYEGDRLLPHRGFSCSKDAIPSLGKTIGTFHRFAMASVEELYSKESLSRSERFEANTLESGVFFNNGGGELEFRPLPELAQISPSFGSAVGDFDADGCPDIYMVHNFFRPQLETRPMDTGLSLLLHGDGEGGFDPVWPMRSGLTIAGDARSLCRTDINGDGRPDFVIGVNDGPMVAFENQAFPHDAFLSVRIEGLAAGARVRFGNQTAEVYAGSGYLSQSTKTLFFKRSSGSIKVNWPDGTSSEHSVDKAQATVTLLQP